MQNYIAFSLQDGSGGDFRKDYTMHAIQLANVPSSVFMREFLPECIYSNWMNDLGILFDCSYCRIISKDDILSSFKGGLHIINFLVKDDVLWKK